MQAFRDRSESDNSVELVKTGLKMSYLPGRPRHINDAFWSVQKKLASSTFQVVEDSKLVEWSLT